LIHFQAGQSIFSVLSSGFPVYMHGNARKLVAGRERLYKSRFTSRQAVQQPQGGGPFGTRLQPELSLAFIDESARMRSTKRRLPRDLKPDKPPA
jgi:hypothetical protein